MSGPAWYLEDLSRPAASTGPPPWFLSSIPRGGTCRWWTTSTGTWSPCPSTILPPPLAHWLLCPCGGSAARSKLVQCAGVCIVHGGDLGGRCRYADDDVCAHFYHHGCMATARGFELPTMKAEGRRRGGSRPRQVASAFGPWCIAEANGAMAVRVKAAM